MIRLLRGPHGLLAWLVLGYMVALIYGPMTGGFTTAMQWVVASMLLAAALFVFATGSEMVYPGASRKDLILGRGMMIAMFSALLLPVVLHQVGTTSIPPQFVFYHVNRFPLAVAVAVALMTGTYIVRDAPTKDDA